MSPAPRCTLDPMKLKSWCLFLIAATGPLFAQLSPAAAWATHAANEYQAYPECRLS